MGVSGQINRALEKAKESGIYLVMISYVEKDTGILQHSTFTHDFKTADFNGCLIEHTKHLNEQRAKAKGVPRGPQAGEEDPEVSPA